MTQGLLSPLAPLSFSLLPDFSTLTPALDAHIKDRFDVRDKETLSDADHDSGGGCAWTLVPGCLGVNLGSTTYSCMSLGE